MQPLDHPPARPIVRLLLAAGGQWLSRGWPVVIAVPPIGSHVGRVAALLDSSQEARVVISGIQAQMLLHDLRIRTLDGDGIKGGFRDDYIIAIGRFQHDR